MISLKRAALPHSSKGGGGFTLIELLVVMAILATLLMLVAPRYFDSLERAKETALRTDLRLLREAIDSKRLGATP